MDLTKKHKTKVFIKFLKKNITPSVFQIGDQAFTDQELEDFGLNDTKKICEYDQSLNYNELGKTFMIVYENETC